MNSYEVLKSSVPSFVSDTHVLDSLYKIIGSELDLVVNNYDSLKGMITSITTSPDDGLIFWEKLYNTSFDDLPVKNRRELLKMKARGIGTLTIDFVKNLVESFENGETEVTDYPLDSIVEIKFSSTSGTPSNIELIKQALDEYLFAHYEAVFKFKYILLHEVMDMTVNQLEECLIDLFSFE